MTGDRRLEALLAEQAPRVLAALARRHRDFGECEEALQEALLAAAVQWPRDGTPDDPRAWLIAVASRRLTDALRSRGAGRRREEEVAARAAREDAPATGPGGDPGAEPESGPLAGDDRDDSLELLFLCCHPAVSGPSRIALTLRAVGGMTTAEIARAFLVPEATMAQRISRAKQRIREAGATFGLVGEDERAARLREVLHVLYLVFNEGHTASEGPDLRRDDLATEAIRLTRMLRADLPTDGEVAGLLALMILTDARRSARTAPDGSLVPLLEQDRGAWDAAKIAEGTTLITAALATAPVGPFQVQAAIAALHAEARDAGATDWPQIVALYGVLDRIAPGPVVALNRAVAVAMAHGPVAGLALVDELARDRRMRDHHRLYAVRAHLLETAGRTDDARAGYAEAARRTRSLPERRYLEGRARRLGDDP